MGHTQRPTAVGDSPPPPQNCSAAIGNFAVFEVNVDSVIAPSLVRFISTDFEGFVGFAAAPIANESLESIGDASNGSVEEDDVAHCLENPVSMVLKLRLPWVS